MSARFSNSYLKNDTSNGALRREVEVRRRQAAAAVSMAMGSAVFAAVFAAAMYLLA